MRAFALAMERELRINDYKGGWDEQGPSHLLKRLRDETHELTAALGRHERKQGDPHSNKARILSEAADVAKVLWAFVQAGALTVCRG